MNEVATTNSMMSDSSTTTNSTSSTGMANSGASMSPSSGDTSMITPVPAATPPSTDTSVPATTPMTTTDASAATGSISSLESSIQSAADTALADAQTQAPATTSGTTASMSTMSVNSSRDYMSNTPYSGSESIGATIAGLIYVAVILLGLISQYVLSRKLKLEYPWLGLIPVVNIYNLVKIAGHDGWKIILLFIPIVNLFYWAWSLIPALSRRTGHGLGVSVGLFFLFPIVFPYIAFTYKGADETLASVSPTVPSAPATF